MPRDLDSTETCLGESERNASIRTCRPVPTLGAGQPSMHQHHPGNVSHVACQPIRNGLRNRIAWNHDHAALRQTICNCLRIALLRWVRRMLTVTAQNIARSWISQAVRLFRKKLALYFAIRHCTTYHPSGITSLKRGAVSQAHLPLKTSANPQGMGQSLFQRPRESNTCRAGGRLFSGVSRGSVRNRA